MNIEQPCDRPLCSGWDLGQNEQLQMKVYKHKKNQLLLQEPPFLQRTYDNSSVEGRLEGFIVDLVDKLAERMRMPYRLQVNSVSCVCLLSMFVSISVILIQCLIHRTALKMKLCLINISENYSILKKFIALLPYNLKNDVCKLG